ncbi:MAG: TetR/AcrR family transcriptional regulator [Proteobacteria bacterium]|nr:TetR/AcrR family transcriptional regulator [Pseudomonadota bacterium]
MRYPKNHKEKIRERLLDDTARHVKKYGFAGSGMDAIATSAGVTSGALYKHFSGKSDMFAKLIRTDLQRTAARFAAIHPGDAEAAEKLLAAYLSLQHVRHPEHGCPLPALTAEVGRADDAVRAAFEDGLCNVHAQVQQIVGSRAKAWALIAQSVGAVMLARATLDPKVQGELLESARAEARVLLTDGQNG